MWCVSSTDKHKGGRGIKTITMLQCPLEDEEHGVFLGIH